jgi:hypothetical protein
MPGIVLVLAIAVGVGVIVYRLTAGGERPAPAPSAETDDARSWAGTSVPGEAAATSIEVPEGYIPVGGSGPTWHARLGGAMGLVIAVVIGAVGLAFALWAVGSFVARLVSGVGETGAPVA